MTAPALKALLVDASSGFYRVERFPLGEFFGPVDLGLHLADRHGGLCFGTGLLAGSILPGSNRMIFTGHSPCWDGFFISSMGGAGLVFDNLGLDLVCVLGRAAAPSVLLLNRLHGEEVQVELHPVDARGVWGGGRRGVYALMDHVLERFADRYPNDPRILAVGPGAASTDIGAIASAPVAQGRVTPVDTWAGRGGLGSRLLQAHGVAAVIYGGTVVDEDFRDRTVADAWFQERYRKNLAAKDLESTTKYRFDPKLHTGGTFGVNYASVGGALLAFNYRTIYLSEQERADLHGRLVAGHYLRQFNEETIERKQFRTCGEPCAAVCKKMHGEYKKDYESYQTLGPLCGVFDQRAAEGLVRAADTAGLDTISAGGVVAWVMECLDRGLLTPEEAGAPDRPVFSPEGFDPVESSRHNAAVGAAVLGALVEGRGLLDLRDGARALAQRLGRDKGREARDAFLCVCRGERGWVVPNQYWTPGVLSPMAIMGKYYMHYGGEFLPPRELGRRNAQRFLNELMLDNLGICRFHRVWAEELAPQVLESLFGAQKAFQERLGITARRIDRRNAPVPWEGARAVDFLRTFLERQEQVLGNRDPQLLGWLDAFRKDAPAAAQDFWHEIDRGIREGLPGD